MRKKKREQLKKEKDALTLGLLEVALESTPTWLAGKFASRIGHTFVNGGFTLQALISEGCKDFSLHDHEINHGITGFQFFFPLQQHLVVHSNFRMLHVGEFLAKYDCQPSVTHSKQGGKAV